MSSEKNTEYSLPAETRIGHVHLKVTDLERSLRFYVDVLGFKVFEQWRDAAFLAAGGYHHHIAINTWESLGGKPALSTAPGLYHAAILYPTREDLARALQRLIHHKIPLEGASDHGVSEALYLRDPDQNGIELYWDKPRSDWPTHPDGRPTMYSRRLDLNELLNLLG